MLALVWLVYFSFGITIGSLPALVSPIIDDLQLTNSQMGLVLGAWQLVYIATAAPLGSFVDRLGIRRSLSIGTVVILISLVARSLAVDFYTLFFAVALFGVGGPIVSVGAPKLVAIWFSEGERGAASGIYSTAPVFGAAFALVTGGNIVLQLFGTWRGMALIYGPIVLSAFALWLLLARDSPNPMPSRHTTSPGAFVQKSDTWMDLLKLRNVQVVLLLAIGTFFINHGLISWTPSLLQERGLTLSQAGSWSAIATVVGATGLITIPSASKHGRRVVIIATLLIIFGVSSTGLVFFSGPALVSSLAVSVVARSPVTPILMLVLMDTPGVGPRHMGVAAGMFFAAAEVGGFGGPFLIGLMRDVTDSLDASIFLLTGLSAAMAIVVPLIREQNRAIINVCSSE